MCKFTWTSNWSAHEEIKSNIDVISARFIGHAKSWGRLDGVSGGFKQTGDTNVPCYPVPIEGSVDADLQLDVQVDVPSHVDSKITAHGWISNGAWASMGGYGTKATVKSVISMWADKELFIEKSATSPGDSDISDEKDVGQVLATDPTSVTVHGDAFYEGSLDLISSINPRNETWAECSAQTAGKVKVFVECHGEHAGAVKFDGDGTFQAASGADGWKVVDRSVSTNEENRTEEGVLHFVPEE